MITGNCEEGGTQDPSVSPSPPGLCQAGTRALSGSASRSISSTKKAAKMDLNHFAAEEQTENHVCANPLSILLQISLATWE